MQTTFIVHAQLPFGISSDWLQEAEEGLYVISGAEWQLPADRQPVHEGHDTGAHIQGARLDSAGSPGLLGSAVLQEGGCH